MTSEQPEWVPPNAKKRRRRRRRTTMTITPDLISDEDDAGCCCVSHMWISKHVRMYACIYMAVFLFLMIFVFIYVYRVSQRHERAEVRLRELISDVERRGPIVGALTYSFTETVPYERATVVIHDKPLPNGAEGRYAFCCDAAIEPAGWRAADLCMNGDGIQSYIADHRIHVNLDVPAEVTEGDTLELACTFAWGGSRL